MLRNWLRKIWHYYAVAETCSLISSAMLVYCHAETTDDFALIAGLSGFMILGLPLMLFILAWMLNICSYYVPACFNRDPNKFTFRCLFRLPKVSLMRAAAIAQIMFACITIGMMIWPTLLKIYS